jgi:hypothetical protein
MKRITRFLGAGATGLIMMAATAVSADCRSELDELVGGADGAGSAEPGRALPPVGPDSEAGAEGAEPLTETGSFTGDLEQIEAANQAELEAMEQTDAAPAGDIGDGAGMPDREAAIEEARNALATGDEAGCLAALGRAGGS